MDDFSFDDRDFQAFVLYAARERSLDSSLAAAANIARAPQHRESIAALRELNKKMLFRETGRRRAR